MVVGAGVGGTVIGTVTSRLLHVESKQDDSVQDNVPPSDTPGCEAGFGDAGPAGR